MVLTCYVMTDTELFYLRFLIYRNVMLPVLTSFKFIKLILVEPSELNMSIYVVQVVDCRYIRQEP